MTTSLTPWSGNAPATPSDSLRIDQNCSSSGEERPFDVEMQAGSQSPLAGEHSPFVVRLTRDSGQQEFERVTVRNPKGLSAKLAGVPYCSEAGIDKARSRTAVGDGALEKSDPSCSAESKVGRTVIGVGAGANPFYVEGSVHLAGPYQGAPLSLVFVVPAVAGPFDLGVQVVRAALHVDQTTAQITAISDEIPKILEGVPLDIRDIRVLIDRDDFTLNPTNCSAMEVAGDIRGSHGKSADLSSRFQVADCATLGFAPRFRAQILNKGRRSTLRSFNPRTRFTVVPRPGDANIGAARVALPSSTILDQSNLDTTCTRERMAAENCPAGSVVGYARAWSPLLDRAVAGPVYLAANGGVRPLPDLVAVLDGQVRVSLLGEISTLRTRGKARLQNTFRVVPDVPVTRFVLTMRGGKQHGLLVNSTDLCRSRERGVAVFHGQNGRRHRTALRLTPSFKGCGKVRRQARKKAARKKIVRKLARQSLTRPVPSRAQ